MILESTVTFFFRIQKCTAVIIYKVGSFRQTAPYVAIVQQENTTELLLAMAAKDFSEGVFERSTLTVVGSLGTARWTRTSGTSAATAA